MKKMIVVDLDGVCSEFDKIFDQYVHSLFPDAGEPDITHYDFRERYPKYKSEMRNVFRDFVNDGMFLKAKALPGIEKVSRLGATIITKRPKRATEDTYAWLVEHKIKFEKVIITTDKSKYVSETAVIMEDHPMYIMPFAKGGVHCFLFDHPYNRHIQHPNIHRVNGWFDIDVEAVKKLV